MTDDELDALIARANDDPALASLLDSLSSWDDDTDDLIADINRNMRKLYATMGIKVDDEPEN